MAEEKKEEKKEEAPAGPKMIMGFPLLQFVFIAVNLLVLLGGFGFIIQTALFYKKPPITEEIVVQELTKKQEKSIDTGTEFLVENLGEMTINLRTQQGGKNRFVTLEAGIVCGSATCIDQVKDNRAKIEDTIQSSISAYTYNELGSLDVKFRIKHDILNKINTFFKETAATDLLFSTFTIQ